MNKAKAFLISTILFFGLFGLAKESYAACSGTSPNWTAASPNQADVQDCVNAASGGDTVNVPAGEAIWTVPLTITKAIHLKGAGSTGSSTTTIKTKMNHTVNFTLSGCAVSPEIEGFLFVNQGVKTNDANFNAILFSGSCDKIKAHDNKIAYIFPESFYVSDPLTGETAPYRGSPFFGVSGNVYGVIYNNFLDNGAGVTGTDFISVNHKTWNGDNWGDGSFKDDPNYSGSGSGKFLYVEGNTFASSARHAAFSDMYEGARMVERYNTITNGNLASHGFDSTGGGRSRSYRIKIGYNNSILLTDGSNYPVCWLWRSGTGLFYGNDVGSGWNYGSKGGGCISAHTYRYESSWPPAETGSNGLGFNTGICWPYTSSFLLCDNGRLCDTPGAPCTNPGTGTCKSYPGQCRDGTGCDTIGADCPIVNNRISKCANLSGPHYMCNKGTSSGNICCNPDGIGNPNPNCIAASACPGGASQCVGPLDNSGGSGEGTPCRDGVGMGRDSGFGTPQAIEPMFVFGNLGASASFKVSGDAVQNVHYYTDDTSGGVKSGSDSAKPATCNAGYAYWATDTRKLYRCNSGGNGWDIYYTEYQCPNPLTGLSGTCDPTKTGTGGYVSGVSTGDTTPPGVPNGLSVK